ncbi:hypothetical protein ABZ816_22350 [Actinosynnema sp. NPDC047251]|uniref:Putative secreted protein n=1 Tax=Saccharothrix espanaensis (strain ATCC 51144 / DSM 44229 / JCM 9112 / NBRC 15066 / NRRL 15764) TaxID=1179773 RepID=K0K814_SACES|nr:hypothetical protein [Saccharothrix espanaensis]CCH33657.1 putative secreted protein [Saccharothrix espanaensis DSM 44229]
MPVQRWVFAVLALALATAGCSTPVAGKPVAGPVTVEGAAPEVVRWMNNFCGVANYMVASGGVKFDQPPADPVAAKKAISDALGRVVDVLNVAVHDLEELTPAPVTAADAAVEVIVEPLSKARDKFVSAKSTVDGAAELTTDVFSAVMQNMTEAVSVMNEAVEKMSVVKLPDTFTTAAEQAENCKK